MTVVGSAADAEPWSFVDALLHEQQRITAVERFSQLHAHGPLPQQAKYYRDLIPLTKPQPGEQYAFDVDLDMCSGCKACVTACHNMNGLEEEEIWRTVGLLHGGSTSAPAMQHVTTSCHHCVDPACLTGCPVDAYEKDPTTGIVVHLDDQCIGCQYCILKCPYDAPKFSEAKGIVRKCDMCRDRLAINKAPACVQACPNRAIRITFVDQLAIAEESEPDAFLPGSPEPGYTLPTTIYRSRRSLPRNLLPADYHAARPQHAHWPLVLMLVLTQASVGTLALDVWMPTLGASHFPTAAASFMRMNQSIAALLLAFAGLSASLLHLGRPLYAFRAWIGLRHSWLSREILAFGLFALIASLYSGKVCWNWLVGGMEARPDSYLGGLAAATGMVAVFCSVMIYVDTRRPYWSAHATLFRFFATAIVLGLPVHLFVATVSAPFIDGSVQSNASSVHLASAVLVVAMIGKLLFEGLIFTHLRHKQHTPLKRTALLLTGELKWATQSRFGLAVVGGVLIPLMLVAEGRLAPQGYRPLFIGFAIGLMFTFVLVGELFERYLFFSAVVAPKMPGSPAS